MSESEIANLTINILKICNLQPNFTYSNIQYKICHLNNCIYESTKYHMDEIINTETKVVLPIDYNNPLYLDELISNPIVITILEYEEESNEIVKLEDIVGLKSKWMSEDSLHESETIKTKIIDKLENVKSKLTKGKGGIKEAKPSKETLKEKKSKSSDKSSSNKSKQEKGKNKDLKQDYEQKEIHKIAGIAILDLLPLFFGKNNYEEHLIIKTNTKIVADKLKMFANLPVIAVNVNATFKVEQRKIYDFTIESIYNIPSILSDKLNYEISFMVPSVNSKIINLNKCKYQDKNRTNLQYKKWFNTEYDTNYVISNSLHNIAHNFPKELTESPDYPRIEFNFMKRSLFTNDDIDFFQLHMEKYRCLAIEIFISKKVENLAESKANKKANSKPGKTSEKSGGNQANLHLMTFVNLCKLLYPGEQYVRLACPLFTYNQEEIELKAGVKESFFIDKFPKVDELIDETKHKGGKGKKEAKTTAPAIPKPSLPIYNEAGQQTYIVIEFGVNSALKEAYNLKKITKEIKYLLENDKGTNKPICLPKESSEFNQFKNAASHILKDIHLNYNKFIGNSPECANDKDKFIDYLKENGIYQFYVTCLIRNSFLYLNSNKREENQSNNYTFISEISNRMFNTVNQLTSDMFTGGLEVEQLIINDFNVDLIAFAYEAMELYATILAQRYILRSVSKDRENWLHYAVYFVHLGDEQSALGCVKEVLSYNIHHKQATVFYALILARRNELHSAEYFALNAVLNYVEWVEGWGVLYWIHRRQNNIEAMQVAKQKGEYYLDVNTPEPINDLIWYDRFLPQNFFYRIIRFFISLKFYDEAESILTLDFYDPADGVADYLLAVLAYYKMNYELALSHINNAINNGGCDYGKCALKGHILACCDESEKALSEFRKVFQLYNQPNDKFLYFVLVRSGLCYSKLSMFDEAVNAFRKACKLQSTAYGWLCLGILYYHKGDFDKAEECLRESNLLDNRMPETWTYLAMVCLKLKKEHHAQICYNQTHLHSLQNVDLIDMLNKAFNY